jgi:hypothetical protein
MDEKPRTPIFGRNPASLWERFAVGAHPVNEQQNDREVKRQLIN